MRVALTLAVTLCSALAAQGGVAKAPAGTKPAVQVLPTGQKLTPLAAPGARFEPLRVNAGPVPGYVADGAAAIATSPDGREMLLLTSGFNRYVGADGKVMPAQSGQYVMRYAISDGGSRLVQTLIVPNTYSGIAWMPNGTGFVVGGGVDDNVVVFRRSGANFAEAGKIALGHKAGVGIDVKPQAAGVAVSPDGRRALVANYYNDSVSLLDLDKLAVIAERDLRPGTIDPADRGKPGGQFPFAVTFTDAGHAWLTSTRDRELVGLAVDPAGVRVTARVATLGEPTALLYDARGKRLIATEDNADRLAVVDSISGKLIAEPRVGFPEVLARNPGKGFNPNSLALLPDGRLLVTLGGVNALAVMAPTDRSFAAQALVPTAWYPSAVAISPGARRVFVANRKSPPGPNPVGCMPRIASYRSQGDACGPANQYIFQLEKAGLLQFPLPGPAALLGTTRQVASNVGLDAKGAKAAAEAKIAAIRPLIKHVIFIIKENRTYDQVLGGLDRGNGDPRLAILGGALSPNHQALARQFVTLDNFMDSGEQSSTGWTWSTAARSTDLLEKTAPVNYARRGLAYEAEQADRNVPSRLSPEERRKTNPQTPADPDLLAGTNLLTAPDPEEDDLPGQGFLWNAAIRAGLSVRNYGFADASVYDTDNPGAIPVEREPFKAGRTIFTASDPALATRSDPYYRGFDLKLPDFWREAEWEREYGLMEAAGTLPRLTLLRLGNDHFGDFGAAVDGVNTVETQMADNDYALGRVIERVAHGKEAASTLIFVIEDDAQNGADHVDARRSLTFVVGPYVRQNAVVSTHYTTVSMLRTIEAVLGLKPMGLNDALAVPMADVFDPAQRTWTYRAVAPEPLRGTKLPIPADRFGPALASACQGRSSTWWAAAMAGQDFAHEDELDTDAFNSALWRGLGSGAEPAIRSGEDLSRNRGELLAAVKPAGTC